MTKITTIAGILLAGVTMSLAGDIKPLPPHVYKPSHMNNDESGKADRLYEELSNFESRVYHNTKVYSSELEFTYKLPATPPPAPVVPPTNGGGIVPSGGGSAGSGTTPDDFKITWGNTFLNIVANAEINHMTGVTSQSQGANGWGATAYYTPAPDRTYTVSSPCGQVFSSSGVQYQSVNMCGVNVGIVAFIGTSQLIVSIPAGSF